ncbi:MAG: hypothetical protein VW226_05155 [Rhodospirillaceae bacterium]
MARINPIPMDAMDPEQRRCNDEIAATRGGGAAKGPFALWLRTPELADKANAFGSFLRHKTSVPQNLVELAVLIVARHYTAQYEWHAHHNSWRKLGLDEGIAEAIRNREMPKLQTDQDIAVYQMTSELLENKKVSEGSYSAAVGILGEQTVLDLVTIIGFYVMVALVLVTFEVEIPGEHDKKPLPE